MGIAQIALNRPTPVHRALWCTFLRPYFFMFFCIAKRSDPLPTPQKQEIAYVDVEKKCSKPSGQALTPPPPNVQCPYENNTFQTGHMRMSRLPKILNN